MATTLRRPLTSRSHQHPLALTPTPVRTAKRPRSPEPAIDALVSRSTAKRVKGPPPSPTVSARVEDRKDKDKERKRVEREAAKRDFQIKYTKAFPSWSFYLDLDGEEAMKERLAFRIMALGGHIEDFFSGELTHLITNKPLPPQDPADNKENALKLLASKNDCILKSPLKLRAKKDVAYADLVLKAIDFGMKIWDANKLESVLDRCNAPVPPSHTVSPRTPSLATTVPSGTRTLSRLLQSERLHGTTERDPTQKRHDFHYFSKSSYFMLVEDMHQELATIYALEYTVAKGRDGSEQGAWPVLYCHPKSRGPFVEFDEKEKKRWERAEKAEKEKEVEEEKKSAKRREEERRRLTRNIQLQQARKVGDLRRSVSMSNLQRRSTHPGMFRQEVDLDYEQADHPDSANASGYLPSTGVAYVAASGNSVGITSTAGTTSAANHLFRPLQLPASLRGRIEKQVVTKRKFPPAVAKEGTGSMGPPAAIPERRNILRKSRSTNTLRLPKREEGAKPGYCESCRSKFSDFNTHKNGSRHRAFAEDDANFVTLDCVLARVQRRTLQQVHEEKRLWDARRSEDIDMQDM